MNWLKEHVYLATWLGLPLAVVLAFFQATRTQPVKVDWFRSVITFAFFTGLAVVLTPTFDTTARYFAGFLTPFLLGVIIAYRNEAR